MSRLNDILSGLSSFRLFLGHFRTLGLVSVATDPDPEPPAGSDLQPILEAALQSFQDGWCDRSLLVYALISWKQMRWGNFVNRQPQEAKERLLQLQVTFIPMFESTGDNDEE